MRSAMMRGSLHGLGLAIAVLSIVSSAHASISTAGVPEIDGSAIPAVLGMLSAGVLMLRARRRSK